MKPDSFLSLNIESQSSRQLAIKVIAELTMDFFPVDTLSIKTADILSRYYSSVTRIQEQIKAENEPETNSDPSQLEEEPSGPSYKRHKIFDPVRRKNI